MNLFAIYVFGLSVTASQQCINSGVNLEGVTYWSNLNPFVNLARLSDEWRRPKDSDKKQVPVPLTSNLYAKNIDNEEYK